MPVRILCPHCGSELRLPESLYQRPAQCPVCEGAFRTRWRPAPDDEAERQPCPHCRARIRKEARKCPACGRWLIQPS